MSLGIKINVNLMFLFFKWIFLPLLPGYAQCNTRLFQ